MEYRELHLKFQNCRWLLTEPLEEQKQGPVSPEVLRLAEFLKGLESFDGTATELAALWEGYAGEPVQPSVLSKKLARYAGELDRLGIRITTSRTLQPAVPGRAVLFTCAVTAVTGVTGKMGQSQYPICCHSRHTCHRRSLRPCEGLCDR